MTKKDQNSLEANFQKLQIVTAQLESDETELDAALEHFEEGITLVKTSQKLLHTAEQRIQFLTATGDQPLDSEETE